MQLSDVHNTLKTSGFNNNWHLHLQSRGSRIIQQVAETIHDETGLASQQRVPLRLREVGLQPQCAVDTVDNHATQAWSISVLNEQIQDGRQPRLLPLRRTTAKHIVRMDTKPTKSTRWEMFVP